MEFFEFHGIPTSLLYHSPVRFPPFIFCAAHLALITPDTFSLNDRAVFFPDRADRTDIRALPAFLFFPTNNIPKSRLQRTKPPPCSQETKIPAPKIRNYKRNQDKRYRKAKKNGPDPPGKNIDKWFYLKQDYARSPDGYPDE